MVENDVRRLRPLLSWVLSKFRPQPPLKCFRASRSLLEWRRHVRVPRAGTPARRSVKCTFRSRRQRAGVCKAPGDGALSGR